MLKNLLFTLCLVIGVTTTGNAQFMLPVEARIDSIRNFFRSPEPGDDLFSALEKMLNEKTRDEGIALFDRLTFVRSIDIIERYRITAVYLHCKASLPDTLLQRVHQLWVTIPVRPLEEEYEKVLYYTSLVLAAEQFPSGQTWFNGKTSEENERDAHDFLTHWANDLSRFGQQSFDSPTYGPFFIASMILLRDFSMNPDRRTLGGLMANWLLADSFHEYFGGQFGGSHAREDLFSAMNPIQSEMSAIAWLYVGDGLQMYSREQYLAALSSFRPDSVIIELASQKFKPFEAVEIKRTADRIRGPGSRTERVIKYTYFDPLYVIGSIPGGVIQPREQHTWDVTWASEKTHTTLFTMQPYSQPDGLMEFIPHSPERAYRSVSSKDPYFGTPSKTVGGSPYERVFQYKNTVIALYDIPNIQRFPMMISFLPSDLVAYDVDSLKTGWITINAGDVYIAYYPLQPYVAYPEDLGQRLVSRAGKNGAIVQVAGRNAIGSYKTFRERIRKSKIVRTDFLLSGRVRYTSIFGDVFECSTGGHFEVNGKKFERSFEHLFDSPWIQSAYGSGIMQIRGARQTITIDIPSRSITRE